MENIHNVSVSAPFMTFKIDKLCKLFVFIYMRVCVLTIASAHTRVFALLWLQILIQFILFLPLQNKKPTMEDDEDLELLRLAALKSLKKENAPAPKSTTNQIEEIHVIPVVSNVRPAVDKYYAPVEPELVQPNLMHHPVPPYVGGFEKLEINDSYIPPPRLNVPPTVAPYEFALCAGATTAAAAASVATGLINEPTTNVQLSPRTAAFVYENKQIIKRRQGISPAHSPVPFRKSPGRWSRSSSRESWKYRRSKSRSPAYQTHHSPHFRNRSMSRSPQRRRHSPPQPAHGRRIRSRSPIPQQRNNFDGNAHRSERRSPVPNRRAANNSPTTNRHAAAPPRPWRGHSGQRDNGPNMRRSGSPRMAPNERRRRTRSPTNNAKSDVRRRTASRSPNRKYPRNNVNRVRRSPPPKRFNNTNNGNKSAGHNGARNRNHNRRSGSPTTLNRNTSHSHRSPPMRRMAAVTAGENGEQTMNKHAEKEQNFHKNEQSISPMKTTNENTVVDNEPNDANVNVNIAKGKSEEEIENGLHASSDSENSDNDDGIDLFASEESESENEGRFKLSSGKSERKANVPRVSFFDLGKTTTAPADILLRDLDELQTDAHNSQRRGGGGGGGSRRDNNDRNNRNHSRRDDRRSYNTVGRDRDRENKDRERDRDRNRDRDRLRERERESSKSKSSSSWKNSKNADDSRSKKDESSKDETTNAKNDRKQTLFKSTFTSIEGETRTKTPDGGKLIISNSLKDKQIKSK